MKALKALSAQYNSRLIDPFALATFHR